MKTAISVPTDVFRRAEKHARRTGKSRSQLYSEAVAEYIARHDTDSITRATNAICERVDQSDENQFARRAAQRLLKGEQW